MCLVGTYFQHNFQKKFTWTHATGHKAEIDYIFVNRNWKQLVTDAVVKFPSVNTDVPISEHR